MRLIVCVFVGDLKDQKYISPSENSFLVFEQLGIMKYAHGVILNCRHSACLSTYMLEL